MDKRWLPLAVFALRVLYLVMYPVLSPTYRADIRQVFQDYKNREK